MVSLRISGVRWSFKLAATMAEISQFWQCPTCQFSVNRNLSVCPNCSNQQQPPNQWPVLSDEQSAPQQRNQDQHFHPASTSQPVGSTQEHRAQIQLMGEPQLPIQCDRCGTALQQISKFCPECGIRLSAPNTTPNAQPAAQVSTQTELSECYFCRHPLNLAESGERHCSYCKRPQPKPEGPPCIHGCGVKLINPGVKVCGRCGKSQLVRIPARQPTDSALSPRGGQDSIGYGYPNTPTQSITGMVPGHHHNAQPFGPPQFGPQAPIQTAIPISRQPPPPGHPHTNSEHVQRKDVTSDPNKAGFPNSPSTTGTRGNIPSVSNETGRPGHPYTARSTKVEGSLSEESGNENELKTPVQETADHSHLQETKSHPLQSADSRKRKKKASETEDTGKSKQNKLDAAPLDDSGQAPASNSTSTDSTADAATKPPITLSDSGATTTTAASSGADTITTAATATDTNKVNIYYVCAHTVSVNLLVLVKP